MGLPSEASSTEQNMAPTENCLNIEGKYKYEKTLVLHSLEMAMRNFKTQTVDQNNFRAGQRHELTWALAVLVELQQFLRVNLP